MRFIHLSDIHFSNDSDHQRVINALCQDLKEISEASQINAIFCTGDVANKGATQTSTVRLIQEVLRKIQKSVGADVPLFLCAGNHDIDLNARQAIYKPIYDGVKSLEDANKFIEDVRHADRSLYAHIQGFHEIAKAIDPTVFDEHPLVHTHRMVIDSQKVGVAILNSAWMTTGGGAKDYGTLFLGERQIDIALEKISDCSIRIALMHHTLEWLSPDEKPIIQRSLAKNFNALVCGHNHDSSANLVTANVGGVLFTSNTGCIYQSRQYFNGYSVLDLDLENQKWTVSAREYYAQRDAFDIAPRFSPEGHKEFHFNAHATPSSIIVPSTAMSTAQERANSKLLSFSASDIAPKRIGAIFVEPPLATVTEKELVTQEELGPKSKEKGRITLREISELTEDILFVGKRESGKTTLLHHVVIDRFQDFHNSARIGTVIDLTSLTKFTEAAALEQAVEFIGSEIRRKDLVEILKRGEALIGFDNALLHNQDHTKLIQDFCDKYPNPRYVVAASEELLDDFPIDPPNNFKRQQFRVYIHSLRTKHTRELSCKWFGDEIQSQDSLKRLAWINAIVTRLRVPRTPFLVSVLLWVFEQKPTTHLINQATTIEVLIDGLLDKFKESKARAEFDSTIQSHFLAEFASALDAKHNEWISSLEFEEFVVDYFKRRGLKVSTRGFTDELLRKGLIYERGEQISFKFDCFRAFFLARKFSETGDSWRNALCGSKIDRYITELDILTGLHRDRKEVLEAVRSLCISLFEKSGIDTPLSRLDELGEEAQLLNDESTINTLEKGFLSEGFNEERRDEIVDMMHAPNDVSMDHEVSRQRRTMGPPTSQLEFVAALQAFSVVLRNSELIDDVNLKRDCLNDILDLWAKFLIGSLDWVKNVDRDVLQKHMNGSSPEDVDSLMMMMRMIVPQAIIGLMSENLSTPKLETFVMERVKDGESLIRTLAVFLALDTISIESITAAKNLLRDCGNNTLIVQTLFFKLLGLYITTATSPKSIELLRDCMSEAFAIFRGVKSLNENATLKGQFLERLDVQRRQHGN